MVEIDVVYEGKLHCRAVHGPSKTEIVTDAPKDNQGRGEAFSPTDLLTTSLGVCMITTMGIWARNKEIDLDGTRIHLVKHMVADPSRRVGRIEVTVDFPAGIDPEHRPVLERIGDTCPVQKSLSPQTQVDVTYRWGAKE